MNLVDDSMLLVYFLLSVVVGSYEDVGLLYFECVLVAVGEASGLVHLPVNVGLAATVVVATAGRTETSVLTPSGDCARTETPKRQNQLKALKNCISWVELLNESR